MTHPEKRARREAAVARVVAGETVADVAADLGLAETTLAKYVQIDGPEPPPRPPHSKPDPKPPGRPVSTGGLKTGRSYTIYFSQEAEAFYAGLGRGNVTAAARAVLKSAAADGYAEKLKKEGKI